MEFAATNCRPWLRLLVLAIFSVTAPAVATAADSADAERLVVMNARFAVENGVIVKNDLSEPPPSPPEAKPEARGWLAYTPPPIAVPIQYYDSRKWNKFTTKPVSGLFAAALVVDRQSWLSQDGASRIRIPRRLRQPIAVWRVMMVTPQE